MRKLERGFRVSVPALEGMELFKTRNRGYNDEEGSSGRP
jgi:hypothetical protein